MYVFVNECVCGFASVQELMEQVRREIVALNLKIFSRENVEIIYLSFGNKKKNTLQHNIKQLGVYDLKTSNCNNICSNRNSNVLTYILLWLGLYE